METTRIQGLHHITLCTGTAQGDVDFFVKVLGQRLIKRTLFYDGKMPIYHLYFADELGTPGTVMTTFPMRRTGIVGRKGTGQFETITYAVPPDSLGFWREHLTRNDIAIEGASERFGHKYLSFKHPDCGIDFEVLEDAADNRKPWVSPHVPAEYAIRGFHSWIASVREIEDMHFFMGEAWNFRKIGQEGHLHRYAVGDGAAAQVVELRFDPDRRQGSWTVGEGTVHHGAFTVPDLETQSRVKLEVEGMGFTDFSDRKNRGYFESIYVRTPGGVMFEATHSLGFTVDESPEFLGTEFKISPQFAAQKEELLAEMNDPIHV
jgi:catechol 2,3-dioxygenase-like lactoylglutathione lyase family enzyme